MKSMNRMVALLLALALLLILCGAAEEPAATVTPEVTEAAQIDAAVVPAPEAEQTLVPVEPCETTEATEAPIDKAISEGTVAPEETSQPVIAEEPEVTPEPDATDEPVDAEAVEVSEPTDAPIEVETPEVEAVEAEIAAEEAAASVSAAAEASLDGSTDPVDNSTTLADGTYAPEDFAFSGGSGKTTIACPQVTVSGGKATATIVFSSASWEYVKASGRQYDAAIVNEKSNFEIPVDLNADNTIIAMTSAMSAAKEVTYVIRVELEEPAAGEEAPEQTESGDVDYDWSELDSNFSMFKVTSCTVKVKGDVLVVTMGTSKNTYDKIYIGSKNDEQNYPDYVQGVKKSDADGYTFTFELPKECLSQSIDFVPGKPDGTWYSKKQYQLVIPSALGEAITPDEGNGEDETYADGEYSAEVESKWTGFKLLETRIKVTGDTMQVTLISGQLNYDTIYIGSASDADKSNCVSGVLTNGNTAFAFTFELPTSALGTTVNYAVRRYGSDAWQEYQYSFTLPKTLGEAADEESADVNSYADGEYVGATSTYNETTINGETAYNSNAGFTVNSTKVVVSGDTARVTLTGASASRVVYDKIFIGGKADAEQADESAMIYASVADSSESGMSFYTPSYTFTIPKSELGTMIRFAAHSVMNDAAVWYEHTMMISVSLTAEGEVSGKEEQPNGEAGQLSDGKYNVAVESSAAMFKVVSCVLTAKDGAYSAVITLSGTGYDKLCIGTAEAAAAADASAHIGYVVDAEGKYTFEIPVEALDTPIAIAAHSVSKDAWYDRTLTFKSEGAEKIGGEPSELTPVPEATVTPEPSATPAPEDDLSGSTGRVDSSTALADGVYTPDKFSYSGGTGKVTLSCSKVTVSGGQATATIGFSSTSYSYVKANGKKYYPTVSGGTSWFNIPVNLNSNNRIIGMTTAMTAAHEVAYTIYIYIEGADASADGSEMAKEAQIIGLTYESADAIESAQLFKIYRYADGFVAIDVADIGRYLLVPEDAEVPVGLDEDATLIQTPVQSAYVASGAALEMLDSLQSDVVLAQIAACAEEECALERVALRMAAGEIGFAGRATEPDYAALLKASCDFAILPEAFCIAEEDERTEEERAALTEVTERLELLGVPAFVDRSMDEQTEEARLEWIKVYGILFGCEELAQSCYEQALTALNEAA